MRDALRTFVERASNLQLERRSDRDLVRLFAYWTVEIHGLPSINKDILCQCYAALDLPIPEDLGNVLSKLCNKDELVKSGNGYRPSAGLKVKIREELKAKPPLAEAEPHLLDLINKVTRAEARIFLEEAHRCLRAEAPRSAIIMTWIVALDHLFEYVEKNKLSDFNVALSRRAGLKIKPIKTRDDFVELREKDFIEICRSAGIITHDMRKILDEKLNIRNTCAHPSTVTVHQRKAVNFIEDLVDNIILKLPL